MQLPKSDPKTLEYFNRIIDSTESLYKIADEARNRGYDFISEVEIKPAVNLADRTEGIIGPQGVAKRYVDLYNEYKDRMKVIFQIFEEIVLGKLGSFDSDEKRVEQAIKTALVLYTEGTVVAPIDGIPSVKILNNSDGSSYIDICFAGPIRAAGATAGVLPILLAERAQVMLNIEGYKPSEKEILRYCEENKLYEKISPRQFKATDDDIRYVVSNCKVCINAVGIDDEVAVNRDMERVKTNKIREGIFLVINDGLCLKAPKLIKIAKSLGLNWDWINRFISVKKADYGEKTEIKPVKKYLDGAAAGRPIFAYPSRFGGFRLRLGRTRTTGLQGKAIHPVTMYLLEEFPAVCSQFKVERPGKATSVTSCDSIEPPYVLLRNNSLVRVNSLEYLRSIKDDIDKILFLGDMLVCIGDFKKSGHPLIPVGFCEEWWLRILEDKSKNDDILGEIVNNINPYEVDEDFAITLSEEFSLPLHPRYLNFYTNLSFDDLKYLRKSLSFVNNGLIKFDDVLIKILRKSLIEYSIVDGQIRIKHLKSLLRTFLPSNSGFEFDIGVSVLENLSRLSSLDIKDKAGNFIGARLGRPEAAKPREMKGNPHGLFPINKLGGNVRSINKAVDIKNQESRGLLGNNTLSEIDVAMFRALDGSLTPYSMCRDTDTKLRQVVFCRGCSFEFYKDEKLVNCPKCNSDKISFYKRGNVDISLVFESALKSLGVSVPSIVKGVEDLISNNKYAEPIEKAILRAKNDVNVFKDGTCRADLIDGSITHFKPFELGLSVDDVLNLGYSEDIDSKPIVLDNQIIPIFPQDIIINEDVGEFFFKVANFVDDLLEKFYNLPRFYNLKSKNDLIGHLFLGLAPHTSAGVVSRLLGFTKARAIFAHPYHVCARRRNVDGDQDSIILMLDALINFSKVYLSVNRGGLMDAPLVATLAIDPEEVDDEVHEMDINSVYDLDVYERAEQILDPKIASVKFISDYLGSDKQYNQIRFTHDTFRFDEGPTQSMYTQIKDMTKKILLQIELQKKIECVDKQGALELVLNTHLFPDLIGNGRSFARQAFRCTKCNQSYRRIPLVNKCTNCGNDKLILTISEGSVKKYLEIAKEIVFNNTVSEYTRERMRILENELDTIFNPEKENQKSIMDFF